MSLKNEIEKTMFVEGVDDRMQDIASLIDSPVEDVKARMKTLSFSDYIKVMSALKSKDESPMLPFGYPAMLILSYFPFLFKPIMERQLAKYGMD